GSAHCARSSSHERRRAAPRTPSRAGRSPGPKGASASEGAADGMPQRVSSKAAEAANCPGARSAEGSPVTLAPSVPPAPRASDGIVWAEKDLPLRDDTRLLGRLLGDVLREQCGVAGFERVEAVRQTAVRFRRAGLRDAPAVK